MNIKQYSILKEYETQMRTARDSNYVRALGTQSREKLAAVYKEIFGRDSGFIGGCGSCMMRNLKELAVPYFEFQAKLKKKNKEDKENGKEKN